MYYWGTSKKLVSGLLAIAIFSTSIPQSHAENYYTHEQWHASNQPAVDLESYDEAAEVGEACFDSLSNSPSYASLAGQLYIFTPHERDNSKEHFNWSVKSAALQKEIANHKIDPKDLGSFQRETTQVYINQLIYNWTVQSQILKHDANVDLGDMAHDPQVVKALSVAAEARKKQKNYPDSWNEAELIQHAKMFNAMVDGVNTLCTESSLIHSKMMKVYNDSSLQSWKTNAELPILLGSQEENTFVDGGIKGVIRKRINEMKAIASLEAGIHEGIMAQTMFGKMYATKSTLRNHVGTFNQKSCVEFGSQLKKLPETKDALWKLMGDSYAAVHNEFKKNLSSVIEAAGEKSSDELLKDYIQSNPTSIQLALAANPSKARALSVCKTLQSLKFNNEIKGAVAQMLAPVTMIATFMTAGAASGATASIIAYSALVLNTYFIGSTIMDISASRDLESRIRGAILANQIDASTGQNMIEQLSGSRPLSYLNIVLSGLGAAAAVAKIARLNKIAKYKDYLDAQGGSTAKKFAATQEAFFGKTIKTKSLTRAKIKDTAAKLKGPEPKGVKHDLGEAKLKDYLNFVKNEKSSGSGMFPNEPGSYGYVKPVQTPSPPTAGGGPGIALKAPATSVKPAVTTKPAPAAVKPIPSTKNAGPINQIAKSPVKNSALIPQTKSQVHVEEDEEVERDPNIAPMPVTPNAPVPPVWPDVISPPYGQPSKGSQNSKTKKVLEDLEKRRLDAERKAIQVIEGDLAESDLLVIGFIYELSLQQSDLGKKARDWLSRHPVGSSTSFFEEDGNPYFGFIARNDVQHGDWTGTEIILDLIIAGKARVGDLYGSLRLAAYSAESKIVEKMLKAADVQKKSFDEDQISGAFKGTGLYAYNGAASSKVRTENAKLLLEYAKQKGFSIPADIIQRALGNSSAEKDKEFYDFGTSLLNPKKSAADEDMKSVGGGSGKGDLETTTRVHELAERAIRQEGQYPDEFLTNPYVASLRPLILQEIQKMSRNQGQQGTLAQAWIKKHRKEFTSVNKPSVKKAVGRGHYDGNASLFFPEYHAPSDPFDQSNPVSGEFFQDQIKTAQDFKSYTEDKLTPQQAIDFFNDFIEIDRLYADMEKNLNRRSDILDELVKQGIFEEKDLKKDNIRGNFRMFADEGIIEFRNYNDIIRKIKSADEIITKLLTEVLKKRGFYVLPQPEENGPTVLRIVPLESSEFYNTMRRLAGGRSDFNKKYSLHYSPVSLHAANASLYVTTKNVVGFGLPTIKLIVLNELSTGERHELRHLYFSLLREKKKDSLYHQAFKWDEGDLVPGKTYNHYLSAEEIPAYANNLKIAVEHLRASGEEDSLIWASESLYILSKGILESTHDFLTGISKNSFSIDTNNSTHPAIHIELPNGKKLFKAMVTPEDIDLYQKYVHNKAKYEVEILRNVYNAQLRLNHVAYQQLIASIDLQNKIKVFTEVEESYLAANKTNKYTSKELDMLEKQVEFYEKNVISFALKIFQSSKETHPNFATLSEPETKVYSPLLFSRMFDPEMIVSTSKILFPAKKTIKNTQEQEVKSSAKNSQPHPIYLFRDGLRVKNYDQLIYKVKAGDELHFGARESFIVDRYLDGYTHWHLILLKDGRVLRLPKSKASKATIQDFLKKQKEWNVLGIPVLRIDSQPEHGRYFIHEALSMLGQSGNLRDYQNNKEGSASAADHAIVEFAKKVAPLPKMKNFIFDQVVYAGGQWKIIVTGLESPAGNSDESSIFDADWILFADESRMDQQMKKAIDEVKAIKGTNIIASNAQKISTWEDIVHQMKKSIPMFSNYYDNRVLLSDKHAFINEMYYLQEFYEIYKKNPVIQAAFDQNYRSYEFERIVKQIVDNGPGKKGENWSDILTSKGDSSLNPAESVAQEVQDLFLGYDRGELLTSQYFNSIPNSSYFYATDQFFIYMDKGVASGENVMVYLDEMNHREFNIITKKIVKELAQIKQNVETNAFPENYFEQHYIYRDQDVRVSRDQKFMIIKARKIKPEGARDGKGSEDDFFLFVEEPNPADPTKPTYTPMGKINLQMVQFLRLSMDDFEWVKKFTEKMEGFNPVSQSPVLNSKDSSTAKLFTKPQELTKRFYINDHILGEQIGNGISRGGHIRYNPLYAKARHEFLNNPDLCVVVIDTRHYFPTLSKSDFIVHSPNGYTISDIKEVAGVVHVYLQDAPKSSQSEIVSSPQRPESVHAPISGIKTLAKKANATSKMNESLKKMPKGEDQTEKLALTASIYAATDSSVEEHAELIRANHYFDDEIDNIQTDVWEEVNTTILLKMQYAHIDQNQVVVILYRAHMTGNDEKPKAGQKVSEEKLKALQTAKNGLIKLGYSSDDASSVISKLAHPDVMILGDYQSARSESASEQEFLDHLKLEIEDITSTRDNHFALARGLLTFFEGVPDQQVRVFTNWLKANYNYAIHWGRNQNGIDWGMSHIQMWTKTEYGSKAVPKETQMTFLVDQKGKPHVLVNRNSLEHGIVYAFDDLVANLEKYIQEDRLISGKPSPQGKYYYQTANAKQDTALATHWNKEEYPEEELKLEPMPAMVAAIKDPDPTHAPTEHVLYHIAEPTSDRIKNLGEKNSTVSALMQKLIDSKTGLEELRSIKVLNSGFYQSVRILELAVDDEYYFKFHDTRKYADLSELGKKVDSEYAKTNLEYSVYTIDQKLTHKYAKSFLLEIDGEKVFFSKKENQLQFNFWDGKKKLYKEISKEQLEMANEYDRIPDQDSFFGRIPPNQSALKFDLPSDVILLDFLLGLTDRSLTRNVGLRGSKTIDYRKGSNLALNPEDYDVLIFDAGMAFQQDPSHFLKDEKRKFAAWYEKYFFDPIQGLPDSRIEIKKHLINSPEFSARLAQWTPNQIKKDLKYLSANHLDQFLKNRQLLLDLALEAGVFAPTNQTTTKKKTDDGLDILGNKGGSEGKGDVPSNASPEEVLNEAKQVLRGNKSISHVTPEIKRNQVRQIIEGFYFDPSAAYHSLAKQWYTKNRIEPPVRSVNTPEILLAKEFLSLWRESPNQPAPDYITMGGIESLADNLKHPDHLIAKEYLQYIQTPQKVDELFVVTPKSATDKRGLSAPVWILDVGKVVVLIKNSAKGGGSTERYFQSLNAEKMNTFQKFSSIVKLNDMDETVKKEVLAIYKHIFSSSASNTTFRDKFLLTFEYYFKAMHADAFPMETQKKFREWMTPQLTSWGIEKLNSQDASAKK